MWGGGRNKRSALRRFRLPALVEQGLRKIIAEREAARQFTLHDASFAGQGLAPDLRDDDWNTLRELAYESRGG